jgi:5'(3')-deoxyribonucleotidase
MEHKETITTIQTERLQRELLSMKYIQEIFKELTDEVTKYLRVPTPQKIEQEEEWVIRSQEKYEKGSLINFVVTDASGDFI